MSHSANWNISLVKMCYICKSTRESFSLSNMAHTKRTNHIQYPYIIISTGQPSQDNAEAGPQDSYKRKRTRAKKMKQVVIQVHLCSKRGERKKEER